MNHTGTITLTTPRLTLRRFTVDDAPAMYRNWASDTQTTRFLTWHPHESPEAVRAVEDHLFGTVGVHRIVIRYNPDNTASGRVAEKCGYVYEGILRDVHPTRAGGFQSLIVRSRLRTEWEQDKKL